MKQTYIKPEAEVFELTERYAICVTGTVFTEDQQNDATKRSETIPGVGTGDADAGEGGTIWMGKENFWDDSESFW